MKRAMAETALSPLTPKPDHVPDALVVDFDIHADPGLLARGHDRILELARTAPPVFWTPRNGGAWVLASHEANYVASRDTETFSSSHMRPEAIKAMMAALPPGTPHIPQPVPINLDPPEHGKYRAPLQKVFSPRTVMALKEDIRVLAAELIDSVRPLGRCEFMSTVAEPLPVQIFLKMLGLDPVRFPEYRAIVKEYMEGIGGDVNTMIMRLMTVAGTMRQTMLDREHDRRDDIISMLWDVEVEGKRSDINDMENYGVLLFIAGLDTVMNGMGLAAKHLAENPDLQAFLRANPGKIPEAAEEMLRRYTFTVPVRFARKDVDLCGAPIRDGDRAWIFLPSADLDAREFPEPQAYDLARENNVHIAFGVGPHRCLGSHLARIELQVLYEELLARLPAFRLDLAKPATYHGGHVIGPEQLHLVWEA